MYNFIAGELDQNAGGLNVRVRIMKDDIKIGKMRVFVNDKKELDLLINFLLKSAVTEIANKPSVEVVASDLQSVV